MVAVQEIVPECPITLFIISLAINIFVFGFTTTSSLWRPFGLLLILALFLSAVLVLPRVSLNKVAEKNVVAIGVALMALHYIDVALLSRWSFNAAGPTSNLGGQTVLREELYDTGKQLEKKPLATVFAQRLNFGWEQCWQRRYLQTPWEVKNSPPFSYELPGAKPTRRRFLCHAALHFLLAILVLDVVGLPGLYVPPNHSEFDSGHILSFGRMRDVTSEEISLRIVSTTAYWLMSAAIIELEYYGRALFAVGLCNDQVANWRPLFGRFSDAWSIRQFWG